MIDPKTRKDISVRIQMSRCSDDTFNLRIEDNASSFLILEIKLDANNIADMMSNRTSGVAPAEYYPNDKIGKTLLVKDLFIDLGVFDKELFASYDGKKRTRDLKQVYDLAEELNPGWAADRQEYRFKCHVKNTYLVIMRRYDDLIMEKK